MDKTPKYPHPLTEEEQAELATWRVYDNGRAFACQQKGWFFWHTRQEWCWVGYGAYVPMLFTTVEEAWEAIKWRVHRHVSWRKEQKEREARAKQRAVSKGRVYTGPEV